MTAILWLTSNGYTAEASALEGATYLLRDGVQVGRIAAADRALCGTEEELLELIKKTLNIQ